MTTEIPKPIWKGFVQAVTLFFNKAEEGGRKPAEMNAYCTMGYLWIEALNEKRNILAMMIIAEPAEPICILSAASYRLDVHLWAYKRAVSARRMATDAARILGLPAMVPARDQRGAAMSPIMDACRQQMFKDIKTTKPLPQ